MTVPLTLIYQTKKVNGEIGKIPSCSSSLDLAETLTY